VRIPVSTYRLQFNREFRFADAVRIIDYLHDLGITDVYASPIVKARPGSMHGYDVIDPMQINPEIGTPEEFDQFVQALQAKGMGLIVDIVPNHMAASVDNPWWYDVLEKGEASPYAEFFDVNWKSKKVLLPILGRPYGEVLDSGELVLSFENGRRVLQYYDQKLPIAAGAEEMNVDQVLSRQHYRLAFWRKAADGINYRRFFDISELIALRAERDDVFEATHKYVLKLVVEGKITGLRIDHIDGLLDPKKYLDRLPEVYVVTEKILGGNEQIPSDWRMHGTTGYDFLNFMNGAFIDREGFHKLDKIYADFTGLAATLTEVFRERKRQVMRELFPGEVTAFAHRLVELAEEDRHARDLSSEELKETFMTVTASLPVYRTYVREGAPISETDHAYIEDAIAVSGKGPAFDFLRRVLLVEPAWYLRHRSPEYLDFVIRWQQFTGPVMAKGLEDTAFYVHNPLVSVNEVGGDSNGPEVYFGVDEFHRRNLARHTRWPHSMNASSTHDTKRSEDARARIDVLSEIPEEWSEHLHRWSGYVRDTVPSPNEQVLIFQSMLGAWPIEADRLKQYVTKALREGKTHTSWIDINEDYEGRVLAFVDLLYGNEEFLKDFTPFQEKIAYFGALSSLSQLVLKITSPGVPDFYRGTDIWDFSLADPDNRRPVEFSSRIQMLGDLQSADLKELLEHWDDGRLKLYVTRKLLNFRRKHADLFLHGEYIPLHVNGAHANHIIAFARHLHDDWCVVAVPRLLAKLSREKDMWRNTSIEMPDTKATAFVNVLTDRDVSSPASVSALFGTLPLAVLTSAK
jgi:(1->4)-alpha-D-glucan 1-alpha-D-glucosylmutase